MRSSISGKFCGFSARENRRKSKCGANSYLMTNENGRLKPRIPMGLVKVAMWPRAEKIIQAKFMMDTRKQNGKIARPFAKAVRMSLSR